MNRLQGKPNPNVAEIEGELLRRVLDQWPILVAVNFLGPLLTSAAIWNLVDHQRLLIWIGGAWLSALMGLALALQHRYGRALDRRYLGRWLVIAAAAHGVAAGLQMPLFVGDHPRLLALLPALTLTVAGLATIALHAHPTAMLAMLAGVLAPSWIAAIAGIRAEITPAIVNIPIAFGLLSLYGRSAYRSLRELLSLRLENSRLLLQQAHRRQLAERAEETKSRWLAVATHDLRQPLQGLLLQLEALQLKLSDLPQIAAIGERAQRTGQALSHLLDSLLEMSSVENTDLPIRRQAMDLSQLLQDLAHEYGDRARRRGLSLRLHVAAGLTLFSDQLLLSRALRNLLENALRYTQTGGLLLAARRRGETLRIEVWDTGIGIAVHEQTRILERYYRVAANNSNDHGLGLGLALVSRIAELLGGQLSLRSSVGSGSVFMLSIPITRSDCSANATKPGLVTLDQRAPTIYVVDGSADDRTRLGAQLDQWGAAVILVSDLADALLSCLNASRPPDLLLCADDHSDNSAALAKVERLRDEFNCAIPTLILSRDTRASSRARVVAANCVFLQRQAESDLLWATLQKMLMVGPTEVEEGPG